MKYKFRAECLYDVNQFILQNWNDLSRFKIKNTDRFPIPDVEVTFESHLTLADLIGRIKNEIIDSHVMWQTIKPINEYTGIRDYG